MELKSLPKALETKLKIKKALFVSVVISLTLLTDATHLQASSTFGQASDFSTMGAGARALGMGGAFTAVSDDASAPYYNPAGLAYLDEHQLMLMHAPLYFDSSYNYLALANPFGDKLGTFALSDSILLSDKIEVRNEFNSQNGTGSFENSAISGSYARKLNRKFAAGVNAKFIQQKLIGSSGSDLGLDAGLMYRPLPFLNFGLFYANMNSPQIKLESSADVYRPVTRLGISITPFKGLFRLSADVIKESQADKTYAAGLEFSPTRLLTLRTGFNENQDYTMGLGINIRNFHLDYAFSSTDLGAFNKVSFTWAWHNIYKAELEPPMKEGRAIYPLTGFENQVAFKTNIPSQTVANWSLKISNQEGKEVRKIEADLRPPEIITWDAKNQIGEPMVDGQYSYKFTVNYKNGKQWENTGDLKLSLPDHDKKEVIDMTLQLNGAKESELSAQQPTETLTVAPVLAPDMTPTTTPSVEQPTTAPAQETTPAAEPAKK